MVPFKLASRKDNLVTITKVLIISLPPLLKMPEARIFS